MGQSVAEELIQLVRGLRATITIRLSHLIAFFVRYKNASSAGAIAGFAIALICTWKYLKSSQGHQSRRSDKRDAPSSSNAPPADVHAEGTSTALAKPLTQPSQRGVLIRDPTSASKLTLAQMVKRQLQGGRRMTMSMAGVVLEEKTPEEIQMHAVVRPGAVAVLLEIARACDLYLVVRVLDDKSEELVVAALDAVGMFSSGGLNRNKVLFCGTESGRTSFARQLDPDWHVDASSEIILSLARFIRHQLHITPAGAPPIASNVFGSDSLEKYFGLPESDS